MGKMNPGLQAFLDKKRGGKAKGKKAKSQVEAFHASKGKMPMKGMME